jgi:hypothetical protein
MLKVATDYDRLADRAEERAKTPKSREEWLSFASKHASALATRLMSEDELRAAGVNPDVKH